MPKYDKRGRRYKSLVNKKRRDRVKKPKDLCEAGSSSQHEENVAKAVEDVTAMDVSCDGPMMDSSIAYSSLHKEAKLNSSLVNCTIREDVPMVCDNSVGDEPVKISGKRLVEISHFFQELQRFRHTNLFSCDISHVEILREKRRGLFCSYNLVCRMCKASVWVSTDSMEKMDPNTAAVAGAVAIGIGHSQTEEFLAALDVPFMAPKTWQKIEQTEVSKFVEGAALEEMLEAGKEEAALAREAGEVDDEGFPLVPVITDGTWAKRSYGTKYNSLSGMATIIGCRTKKVLFIGIKNKYCTVCVRSSNKNLDPPEHTCYLNWTGSSGSMEAAVILEGFQRSVELHGVKFNKIVGDGDSSVYNELIKWRPYPNLSIEKVECYNHLLRNFCHKLRALTKDRTLGPMSLRRQLEGRILRLRRAVSAASIYWNGQDVPIEMKINNLKRDIRNCPNHVFGLHDSCDVYYCTGPKQTDDPNIVNEMIASGLWAKITDLLTRLSLHSRSLVQRLTSNLAENFNSLVAKLVGGKRVNFALRGSYSTRCLGAVVSQNSRRLLSRFYRIATKKSPGIITKRLEERRQRTLLAREAQRQPPRAKRRLMFEVDKGSYGPSAAKPDLPLELYLEEEKRFLGTISIDSDEASKLEEATRNQNDSELWHEERRKRLTASSFGRICKKRDNTLCAPIVDSLLYKNFDCRAMAYGRAHEARALTLVEELIKEKVEPCGLFVDPKIPYLGATPDGIIGMDTLVEIKCPYSAKDLTPIEGIKQGKFKFLKYTADGIKINRRHDYYYQIQGQLFVTKRKKCILVMYTNVSPFIHCETIYWDEKFWSENMEKKLSQFYLKALLPELVDPRKTRSLEIREPPPPADTESLPSPPSSTIPSPSH